MNTKILISIILIICTLYHGSYAQGDVDPSTVVEDTKTEVNGKVDNPTATATVTDSPDPTSTELDPSSTMGSVIDGCGTTNYQVGMFSFNKPISKSVLVQFSNFTIIWYYNNIIYDNYTYPMNNVTISLFYEEDANSNNWSTSWKKPVWTKTLSLSEIEDGPLLTNNVKSYQWNWKIMYDDERENLGFLQTLRTNEKYKLRISGDGKDLQTNKENFKCYHDGDIMPGSTRAFYIVENTYMAMKYYHPIKIEDSAFSRYMAKSPLNTAILLLVTILFYYFY